MLEKINFKDRHLPFGYVDIPEVMPGINAL